MTICEQLFIGLCLLVILILAGYMGNRHGKRKNF